MPEEVDLFDQTAGTVKRNPLPNNRIATSGAFVSTKENEIKTDWR